MINKKFVGTESVTVSIDAEDLEVLCNTGKYSVATEFEDYLQLKSTKEIKFLRKAFGEDAKLILAYIIGLCEDNCSDNDKVNTIPYGDLNIQVKVCDSGVFIFWEREVGE